ncbi:hypothetical protein D3C78_615290 [compost metagenome]
MILQAAVQCGGLEPAHQQAGTALPQQVFGVALQQADQPLAVGAAQGVLDGRYWPAHLGIPGAGAAVQQRHAVQLGLTQLVAEKLAEQRVIAVPASLGVLWAEEQLRGFDLRQQGGAVAALQQMVAERRAQLFEHAAADQELAQCRRLASQHVFQQVLAEGGVAAVEGVDEGLRIVAPLQGQRDQPQCRDPAFGALLQAAQLLVVEFESVQAAEEFAGFLRRETQVCGGDFQQLAMRAEASEADVRGAPGADQQLAMGRQIAGDLAYQVEHGRIADRLEVIEEQGERGGQHQQPVGQVDRRAFGGAAIVQRRGQVGRDVFQGGEQMADEAAGVVVGIVQRQPGDLPAILSQQFVGLAHDGRLAEAGWSLHHHQTCLAGADSFDDALA